jgi:myo-inositol-1(or 4)-monophosphatase
MEQYQPRYPLSSSALINVMINAIFKVNKHVLRDFGEIDNLQVSKKGAMDFVTATDQKVEKILFETLKKARPDFGFLMEEGGEVAGKSEFSFVIDPIDGTTNFMHAVPYFCTSIGVQKQTEKGFEIVAGVIYDHVHDEMFMAEIGKGAFVNQRRLLVSKRAMDYYFVTGTSRKKGQHSSECSSLADYADGIDCVLRRGGAAALDLAYVAAGRYDAAWFPKLKKWDMAAGIIMVREAGGVVCLPNGEGGDPYDKLAIFAGSPSAHQSMIKRVA